VTGPIAFAYHQSHPSPITGGGRQSLNFGKLIQQTVEHQQLDDMKACFAFWSITWGVCGADSRHRKQEIHVIPLLTCSIFKLMYVPMLSFTGLEDEADHIYSVNLEYLQRQKRVMPWSFVHCTVPRWASTRCRTPPSLYNHGTKVSKVAERGNRNREKWIQNALK